MSSEKLKKFPSDIQKCDKMTYTARRSGRIHQFCLQKDDETARQQREQDELDEEDD